MAVRDWIRDDAGMQGVLSHNAAIDAICGCAATVTTLSYQEAIEGYLKLRGIEFEGGSDAMENN